MRDKRVKRESFALGVYPVHFGGERLESGVNNVGDEGSRRLTNGDLKRGKSASPGPTGQEDAVGD